MKRRHIAAAIMIVAGFSAATTAANAAGDAAAGKTVFARCSICHSSTKGAPNNIGPNLFGVVGRKAGTAPNFNYSNAMKTAGFNWTADKLDAYLKHPALVVPGNRMAFAGVSNDKDRANLIAYLATLK